MSNKTKFILTFIGGIFVGMLLLFGFLYVYVNSVSDRTENNVVLLKEKREFPGKEFRIIQVLSDGSALATVSEGDAYGAVVFFQPKGDEAFYDEETIEVPDGAVAVQIGTYRYVNKQEFTKTVPVIDFYER